METIKSNEARDQVVTEIEQKIAQLSQKLEPREYTVLEACPFVVVSPDATFSVSTDCNRKCFIEAGRDQPTQFSDLVADDIVANFKAYNGFGQIDLVKMTPRQYLQIKLDQATHVLTFLASAPPVA